MYINTTSPHDPDRTLLIVLHFPILSYPFLLTIFSIQLTFLAATNLGDFY